MPRFSPFSVALTDEEERYLRETARKYTSPYCDVIRAKVVLLAAEGQKNTAIAARLDLPRQIVSKWRKRFCRERLGGLESRPRRGRPTLFPPPRSWSRSRLWPVNCPARRACPSLGSVAPRLPERRSGVASSLRSADARCGGGWMPTPSARGRIAVGFFPATSGLRRRPVECRTCTKGFGKARLWGRMIT
jgi:hypothetical protein